MHATDCPVYLSAKRFCEGRCAMRHSKELRELLATPLTAMSVKTCPKWSRGYCGEMDRCPHIHAMSRRAPLTGAYAWIAPLLEPKEKEAVELAREAEAEREALLLARGAGGVANAIVAFPDGSQHAVSVTQVVTAVSPHR